MNTKVSIIIPICNAAFFVEGCLRSISNQTYDCFEIIFIDNLSTDGTVTLINAFAENDKRIRVITEKDNGIYDAMNKGIAVAKGEWVYFMGADDRLSNEDVLINVYPFLQTGVNEIVYGDCIWMPEKIKESGEWTLDILLNANLNHQRIFYKKDVITKFGSFNTKYKLAADHEANIRLFCTTELRKKYIPLTIANYHSGGLSSRAKDLPFIEDWELIFLANFQAHFSRKIIYSTDGAYIRLMIDNRKYSKAINALFKHLLYTQNVGFLKLILIYFLKHRATNAS